MNTALVSTTKKILLFILFAVSSVSAERVAVNTSPANAMLPSNSVNTIMQDKDGFLWFGTMDGLSRFDGYNVLTFRSNTSNPNLLTDNEITALTEDFEHNLWIGTKSGLNILHRETFEITRFIREEINDQSIRAVLCASDSTVWIAANSDIYRYHSDHNTLELMNADFTDKGGVNNLYEDKAGNIWALLWCGGIHQFKQDGTWTHYPPIGTANNPFSMLQDKQGQYWVCTWFSGLFKFYPDQDEENMFLHQPIYKNDGTKENLFFSIVQDDTFGYLWLMSGLNIYAVQAIENHQLHQIKNSHLFEGSNRKYKGMIKDRKGNIWVGTYDEGVFSIHFDKPDIQNFNLKKIQERTGITPHVVSLYKDSLSNFWFNQNEIGLCIYNSQSNEYITFHDIKGSDQKQLLENVISIVGVGNESWIAMLYDPYVAVVVREGKDYYLRKTYDFSQIDNRIRNIKKIFKDAGNNIWVLTDFTVFVKPHHEDNFIMLDESIQQISGITEAPDGKIWLSARKTIHAIAVQDKINFSVYELTKHDVLHELLKGDRIVAIISDLEGSLWIGTKNGSIFRYQPQDQIVRDLTKEANINDETILDMLADGKHNIWISTNKRIIEYNQKMGAARDYSKSDGLLVNSFYAGTCFYDTSEDAMYFGGSRGICRFSSFNITENDDNKHQVVISDVKINEQSLLGNPGNRKLKAVSHRLILSPDDKNLEIDFTSLNYTYPEKIIYAYRMLGTDNNWIQTNRQFAGYNKLKKGNHVFQVKATDENRLWSDEIATFLIYKEPAFYETWWAYVFYVLIILSAAYWAFRIIHNRIKLRQRLQIVQIEKEKSEELTQTKLRYFTNISHDLLTPLTIISCLIDDIETVTSSKVTQFNTMRANVNRLKRLLQQVLDFRKMESGNMKLRVAQGDIAFFIRDICMNSFNPLLRRKNIHFTFDAEPTHIPAYFDADKIEKIVFHLLSNALKYTAANGKIEVRLKIEETQNGLYLNIDISDTGIGILAEDIEHIFDRFYHNKHMDAKQTNGIGLSLTRDLVELHHGTISVESQLNEGSVFTVVIPIEKNVYAAHELDSNLPIILNDSNTFDELSVAVEQTDENPTKMQVNLLLVEDNEDILTVLQNILQKRYHVFTAINGYEALEMLKKREIDIIISDVMMPEMDGLELTKTLRKDFNYSHIPILLLTARNSVEDRIACYDAGADGYISKPFDVKLLQARITNFLVHKQQSQEHFKSNVEVDVSALNVHASDKDFLDKAVGIIENHIDDSGFGIDVFAEQMNVANSSLHRKIKAMTGLPPVELIRNIRLKHAAQILKNQTVSISEVAYSVGFTDPRYFSTCFKTAFGKTPTAYQKESITK